MNFKDIHRQTAWQRKCQMKVNTFTEPRDAPHGFVQAFNVTDPSGFREEILYYFDDEQMAVRADESPEWFDIKSMGDYYKCVPVDAPADVEKTKGVDWDAINLGKCRHGILCAYLHSGLFSPWQLVDEGKEQLDAINKLAEFSMTGEIVLDND